MTRPHPKTPADGTPRRSAGSSCLPSSPVAAGQGNPAREAGENVSRAGPQTPGAAPAEGREALQRAAPGTSPVATAMSENELEQHIRRILADLPSVLAYHTRDSRRSPSGFPDWVFVGPHGLLFRELKREGKKPTVAQAAWLTALVRAGQDACVWKPSDLLAGRIARRLAAIAGLVAAGGERG